MCSAPRGETWPNSSQISYKLDEIAQLVLKQYPKLDSYTCRDKAKAVATYLRENNLTGIENQSEYHALQHNFLGMALNDIDHSSLPLISAVIYCCVAQRCGLNAQPSGFPFHVHAIVRPPRGFDADGHPLGHAVDGEPLYMDPFRSDRETAVASLRSQLNVLGLSDIDCSAFLRESRVPEIVIRCSTNILNSIRRLSESASLRLKTVDVVSAKYAALWSAVMLSNHSRHTDVRNYLPLLMDIFAREFPSDNWLIEEHIAPIFHGALEHAHILESLRVMRAVDEIPRQVKRRSLGNDSIKYRVGQVFRHKRYAYTGIVSGWDSECGAGEQWMRRMEIDRLQGGRHQSFYHVLYVQHQSS